MEYVAGETLYRRLQDGRLALGDGLRVAGEIAEAIQEAHASGILHRDLKPANIMLTQQGHVKVMDFGLAKRVEDLPAPDEPTRELGPQLTARGAIVGTPDYMSPEQVKGLALDARSDLFSFGVILAEMIGGQHPFRKPSIAETLAAVLHEPPALNGDIPPAVLPVVRRLLEKSPEARYRSAASVHADLMRLNASPSVSRDGSARVGASTRWKPAMWAALAIALALVGYLTMNAREHQQSAVSNGAPAIRSIAVLPLDNYSGDPNQEYFAEGMTDELTADLATISQLRVISRGSAMQFSGKGRPSTPEIGRTLSVDALIEGSVSRSGDRVRITAQLIDARADRSLWARSFERTSSDVMALQAELASAIAHEVNVRLTPSEQSRLTAAPSVDPAAHDAYLKGRYFFNRPSDENLQKAIAQFENAVALSPTFAPAFSGLSDAYLWAGYNEGFITASDARPRAKAAAEKAVELNENSAEAHTSLAAFKLFYERDWTGCEREFRQALGLNANYGFAHDQFGMALAFQGRFDESIAEGTRAIELDPLSPQVLIDAALPFMFRGDVAAARKLTQQAASLDPSFFFPVMLDGWADLEVRNFRKAIPALKRAKAMESPPFVTAFLAFAYGAAGDRAGASAELADLEKRSPEGKVLPFNIALVHLGLGERARAIDDLERALAADSQMMVWIGRDAIFNSIRSEPRFIALLKKIGLDR
jgi:serine/threonine-protein kinase